jgi:hypothetical protein
MIPPQRPHKQAPPASAPRKQYPAMRQLNLFDAALHEQVQRLSALVATLEGANGDLERTNQGLTHQVESLQRTVQRLEVERHTWRIQAQAWRQIAETGALAQRQAPRTATPATLEPLLKRLLRLAHPDKWSQGQPASALAHELAIAINDVRTHLEGQP